MTDFPKLVRQWTVPLLGLVLAAVGVAWFGTLGNQQLPQQDLPRFSRVDGDLHGLNRAGEGVSLKALAGRVRVMACLYTVCPHGCAAVSQAMKELHEHHGSNAAFAQVSLSVAPDRDTPAFLDAYAEALEVERGASWWFVTGRQDEIWTFLSQQLGLEPPRTIPEDERINPLDIVAHDLRMVLIDRQDCVRGYYAVFHPQTEIAELMKENLRRDVARLLTTP